MNTDKLVHMANQIADFFKSYPEPEARAGIRDHVVAFWTPRMVNALEDRAATTPSGLSPLAEAAMRKPTTAQSPTDKATQGPQHLGHLASDAG